MQDGMKVGIGRHIGYQSRLGVTVAHYAEDVGGQVQFLEAALMYIDCETCGFESQCFLPLGKDYAKQLGVAITENGCSYTVKSNGVFEVKCPKGHKAEILPTEIKFRKRYKPPENRSCTK